MLISICDFVMLILTPQETPPFKNQSYKIQYQCNYQRYTIQYEGGGTKSTPDGVGRPESGRDAKNECVHGEGTNIPRGQNPHNRYQYEHPGIE